MIPTLARPKARKLDRVHYRADRRGRPSAPAKRRSQTTAPQPRPPSWTLTIKAGRSAGATLAYGYKVVPGAPGRDGVPEHGMRRIDETEAVVVRRIFMEFAGRSWPKKIAQRLNAEGAAGPRGER